MQKNTAIFIQVLCIVLLITAFSLPWIEKGLIAVSGFKVPLINEKATKVTNLLYAFTPSKKSVAKIGYVFYLVPMLSIIAGICLFLIKRSISKYILLLACAFGLIFSLYFYNTMKFSLIGNGPHLLLITSVFYMCLFFTPLMKKKKLGDNIEESIDLEKSEEQTPIQDHLDNQNIQK